MDNFSLTRHVRHRTIGSWELASRSTEEGWGNALSGARPVDTAPTQLGKTSRTKNLITELYRWASALAAFERWLSVSSMTRLPEVMPWCRRMTRTLATRRWSHGILLCRNIHDRAASEYVPRLARSKRAQQMELVTSTAVTQKASQARCVADIPQLG